MNQATTAPSDLNLVLSDVTNGNFSTTKHGFVPKSLGTGKFLKDDGTWAAAGGGSAYTGTVTINFGANTKEDSYAKTTVTNANVASNSVIMITPAGTSTATHDPDDYQWDNISAYVSNIQAGIGFDIIGVAPNGSFGTYNINYLFT